MTQTAYNATVGYTYQASGCLEVHECPQCGVLHGVPAELVLYASRHKPCYPIYCPNGHTWGYGGPSHEERLAAERRRSGRLAAERDQLEARRIAQKAATTRARKRHAAGICPACKRTFQNVRQHMASQHPDFDPSRPEESPAA